MKPLRNCLNRVRRMPPTKKEDYEAVFNKLLGTSIQWRKLSLEELIELAVLFNHPEVFLSKLGLSKADHDTVTSIVEMWKNSKGPLATLYRRLEQKATEKTTSPLGFFS